MAEEIKSPLQADEKGNIVEEPVEIDLEKQRDDKCIPVAHAMFADIATDMISPDANIEVDYNPVLTKLLGKAVEADLNLVTENPYVFQLMLGMLSALNKTVQECEVTPIDDVRYGEIARKILTIVSEANVTVGEVTPEQTSADFLPVKERLNALFAEEKMSFMEIKYVMETIFKSFETVQTFFMTAVDQSVVKLEERLMDIESINDITMGMVIDMQRKLGEN